jgi:hypothetical protein
VPAYTPSGPAVVTSVVLTTLVVFLLGYALVQTRAKRRIPAWLLLIGAVFAAHWITRYEPPGVRMIALIAVAMVAVKAIVAVEANTPLRPTQWLAFMGWPGMQPRLFANPSEKPLPRAKTLLARGAVRIAIGAALFALGRILWPSTLLASAALLAGLSFMLHFGICNLLAGFWRSRGVACDALFRSPWRSRSLTEFWGRRWNLAFSEMSSRIVYRPLQKRLGQPAALAAAFLLSGILHEMAISLPVRAGFGLPFLYFTLHGALVVLESRYGSPAGWMGRAWTLFWLVAPLPLLFHRPFLAGVVWPLAGIPENS